MEKYSEGEVKGRVRWIKKVSGHGKGEIDSAHAAPKNDVRRHIYRSGGATLLTSDELISGFESGFEIVKFLNAQDRYNKPLSTKADRRGFTLRGRIVHFFDPELERNAKGIFFVEL